MFYENHTIFMLNVTMFALYIFKCMFPDGTDMEAWECQSYFLCQILISV